MYYCRCFFTFQPEISEMCWPIDTKFCTVIRPRLNFIMPVPNFERPSLKNFRDQKCKNWHNFGQLQTLTMNTSGTAENIQN